MQGKVARASAKGGKTQKDVQEPFLPRTKDGCRLQQHARTHALIVAEALVEPVLLFRTYSN